jgi:hypothetical protein
VNLCQRIEAIQAWVTPRRLNYYLAAYLLAYLVPFIVMESTSGVLDRMDRVRGRDFIAFYTAGTIVAAGDVDRVYDQDYFFAVQRSIAEVGPERPRHYSLYPPPMVLLFSLPARLSYDVAVVLWWLTQVLAFAAAFCLLLKDLDPAPAWRPTVCLAFAAFGPVIATFYDGQMAGFWLLILTTGLLLRRRGRLIAAGLVLSLLALKPSLALGIIVWLVVRGQLRTGLGFCLGGLLQLGLTSVVLGPEVFPAYVRSIREYEGGWSTTVWAVHHVHSVKGILRNFAGGEPAWVNAVHLFVVSVACLLLVRIAWVQRWSPQAKDMDDSARRSDEAAAVLVVLLTTPYLLTYDVSLLLVPICHFWSMRLGADRREEVAIGTLLYLSGMVTPLYTVIGFSLVPALELAALAYLSRLPGRAARSTRESAIFFPQPEKAPG